jgi:Resolvase, N terminal domain
MSYANHNNFPKQTHLKLAVGETFSLASPDLHSTHESSMSDTWLRNNHQSHKPKMVAYIRTSGNCPIYLDQAADIIEFCKLHDYQVDQFFDDKGDPSYGLREAMEALQTHDGLIAVDLDRFVEHKEDRLRDLRPLIHHFLSNSNKRLVAIKEGVDTAAPAGQLNALNLMEGNLDTFNY